ncbi:START-like domain-containing protein [Sphingobacterium composti Ten et al. 2007 non Yoo et al. 2007]|uniref:START-like domain-containing protein n=1 Tax=Sphingobacterium composti TaxID=363260 RepID=UPI001357A2EE|nr:START-like domain-containing protein [Sphingobacterium composti Ten et al. 2007 non Yoo et al. 2007]
MSEKTKIQLEYMINSSPRILYPFLVEPNELAQWFADDVNYHDGVYEFIWDNESNRARIAAVKENKSVKFKWLDDEPNYFEMEIIQDELTNDVSLAIVDFVKDEDLEERKKIWDNSISYLQSVIGA